MMIRTLSAAVLGVMLASPVLANPFLHDNTHKPHLNKNALQSIANENYADFTGDWEGRCSEQDELDTIQISNDQFSIIINNEEFDINGLSSKINSTQSLTEGEHLSLRWNNDKSALIMSDINFGQLHKRNGTGSLETTLVHGDITLDNNKLIVKGAAQRYDDGQPMESINILCTYTKK